jgi:hypothetical protein
MQVDIHFTRQMSPAEVQGTIQKILGSINDFSTPYQIQHLIKRDPNKSQPVTAWLATQSRFTDPQTALTALTETQKTCQQSILLELTETTKLDLDNELKSLTNPTAGKRGRTKDQDPLSTKRPNQEEPQLQLSFDKSTGSFTVHHQPNTMVTPHITNTHKPNSRNHREAHQQDTPPRAGSTPLQTLQDIRARADADSYNSMTNAYLELLVEDNPKLELLNWTHATTTHQQGLKTYLYGRGITAGLVDLHFPSATQATLFKETRAILLSSKKTFLV